MQASAKKPAASHSAESPCPRTRVAEGPIASVDACGCGVLHLQIGALTLRLAPEAIASLQETLTEAAETYAMLSGRRLKSAPPPDPSVLGLGSPRGRA